MRWYVSSSQVADEQSGQIKNLKIRNDQKFFYQNQKLIRNGSFFVTSRYYVMALASNALLGFLFIDLHFIFKRVNQ
jgi:hypothetical protein